jgi:hypothetical protein
MLEYVALTVADEDVRAPSIHILLGKSPTLDSYGLVNLLDCASARFERPLDPREERREMFSRKVDAAFRSRKRQ